MKKQLLVLSAVFCCLAPLSVAHAAVNGGYNNNEGYNAAIKKYNGAINKRAEANPTAVYSAYGRNMSNLIKQGAKDGVVVNGAGEYADGQVKVDGVGNVVVQEGAKVNGPIITETDVSNANVIMTPGNDGRRRLGR